MTKAVFAALTLVSLAPGAAQGAVVVAAPPPPSADADGFDLAALVDGADHVLASVDAQANAPSDPFGAGAIAFAAGDTGRRAMPAARDQAAHAANYDAVQEPLPEPATWLMMILGFFGLSFAVRRRAASTGDRVRFS